MWDFPTAGRTAPMPPDYVNNYNSWYQNPDALSRPPML
ncbi:hypothetical protein AB205_0034970 [Aquarana catesbeiana]|uniref:Uncharacterized protein n=2 Tax=Aquarana catesbeiana TaxID=8400 RepID=A0A2G9SDI4_AQUCT|nr:hypothetical protein AB205_0034970 [Aquarana catesbeiana]